jgi:hypothetical protein
MLYPKQKATFWRICALFCSAGAIVGSFWASNWWENVLLTSSCMVCTGQHTCSRTQRRTCVAPMQWPPVASTSSISWSRHPRQTTSARTAKSVAHIVKKSFVITLQNVSESHKLCNAEKGSTIF